MQERDFKGVWIPKEIWLNKELTMLEKIILVEVDSLDNEDHCTASNKYLAEFCQCSERKVSEAITKLIKLELIEVLSFDGRRRVLKSNLGGRALSSIQPSKICEADKQNLLPINIASNINKTDNTNVLSTENSVEEFLTQDTPKKSTTKKQNLYSSCLMAIDEFTSNQEVRDCLKEYLNMRLANRSKPIGIASFKGMLKKLRTLTDSKETCIRIIQQATDRCYLTFYPIKGPTYNTGCPEIISPGEKRQLTDEEYEEALNFGEKF